MQYHELNSTPKQSKRRVGRGIAAGQGKTAGRGTKGQGARTGSSRRPGFEGGQNPLMQRLPKLRGFRSLRVPSLNVYTDQLDGLGSHVTNQLLFDKGLTTDAYAKVKLLYRGEMKTAVTVELQGASLKAMETVQQAGGTFSVVARPKRVAKKSAEA